MVTVRLRTKQFPEYHRINKWQCVKDRQRDRFITKKKKPKRIGHLLSLGNRTDGNMSKRKRIDNALKGHCHGVRT